jgi:hypothetical protein
MLETSWMPSQPKRKGRGPATASLPCPPACGRPPNSALPEPGGSEIVQREAMRTGVATDAH